MNGRNEAIKKRRKYEVRARITNELHGVESFLRSLESLSYSRIYQHFMEPEGLLTRSQQPATYPYPDPDQSSPYHLIVTLKDTF
jgi:hypothetical protein